MSRISRRFSSVAVGALLIAVLGISAAQDHPHTSRGYLTTPQELQVIANKAEQGIEPYAGAVAEVMHAASRPWNYSIDNDITCNGPDNPRWVDERGVGIVYANALAYHLTGDTAHADRVIQVIKTIMSTVITIPDDQQQCRLNFAWGTPEYVASADLIEAYWQGMTCLGPTTTIYADPTLGEGDCKRLFQNWLVKNPYYIVSYAASAQSNWGAAATNTTAYIADYLWDRPDVTLLHRHPMGKLNGADLMLTPAQAYVYARTLTLDRLNGFGVEYDSQFSCDLLAGTQQVANYPPVKSQITERGIIPEDARREEYCNIAQYDGDYENYPQVHINNTLQQCELLLRRGDSSCYDNISLDDIPEYHFVGPDGQEKVTHLYSGRGSVERAINAIIIDSGTDWKHDSALYVAYRYYLLHSRFNQVAVWKKEMDRSGGCSQGICWGQLTHGLAQDELPKPPPTVLPPQDGQS